MKQEIKEKIEKALKEALQDYGEKRIQMFNCVGWLPDAKITLFETDNIRVDYAYGYGYVELIGLSQEDYNYFFEKYGCVI